MTGIMVNSGLDISFMHFGLAFWFSFGLVNTYMYTFSHLRESINQTLKQSS